MTLLEYYESDPVHISIKKLDSKKAGLYGLALLQAVKEYPLLSGAISDFTNKYEKAVDDHLTRMLDGTFSTSWREAIQTYEGLLAEAVEIGDNALESCVFIPYHLLMFTVTKDLEHIFHANIDFLNFCDYISQEYELKEKRPSEEKISSSATMHAHRALTSQLLLSLNTAEGTDELFLQELSRQFRKFIKNIMSP